MLWYPLSGFVFLFCFLFFFVIVVDLCMWDLRDTWKGKHRLDWCVDHGKIRVGGFKQRRWLFLWAAMSGVLQEALVPFCSWYHRAQPCVPSRPGLHRAGSGQAVPLDSSLSSSQAECFGSALPEAQGEGRTSLNRFRDVISGLDRVIVDWENSCLVQELRGRVGMGRSKPPCPCFR